MKRLVVGLVMALSMGTGTAQAQGTGSGMFVSGSVFAGIEKHPHGSLGLPSDSVSGDTDGNGTVPGGGFAVGAWLAPRVTVQLEAALLGSTATDYTLSLGAAQSLLDAYLVASGMVILPPRSYTTRYQQKESTHTVSVLAGYHPAARGRLRIGLLAGIAIARQRTESTYSSSDPGFPPYIPPTNQTETSVSVLYPKGAVLGADGEIRATTHLSIVPQLRVVAFSSDLSIRPGVSARWTF